MKSDPAQHETRRGLLLTSNLLFSSMVTGTAAANGNEVVVADNLAEAEGLCRERPVAFVIIDLSVTEPDIATIVARLRTAAGAVPAIAFGSHVDKTRLDEALRRRLRRSDAEKPLQFGIASVAAAVR